ncbi:MAG: hypothetical protein GF401_11835 [Chitinivibrionales bacterium]|nr:hypothetical protein [Chitinivibrionales bacterium]
MKKTLIFGVAVMVLLGCTENKIKVQNDTNDEVLFNFRANVYSVAALSTIEVSDEIPNGTYAYTTGHQPYSSTGEQINSGQGLTGDMSFNRDKTEQYILYWAEADTGGYTLHAVVSTTDPQRTVTAP